MSELLHKAETANVKASKALDVFGAMSEIARSMTKEKRAADFFRWTATVHPLVKGGQTQWATIAEFVSALYDCPVPTDKSSDARREEFTSYLNHFNYALRTGRRLLGLVDVKDGAVKAVDYAKVAARPVKQLDSYPLDKATAIVSALMISTRDRQAALKAKVAKRTAKVNASVEPTTEANANALDAVA